MVPTFQVHTDQQIGYSKDREPMAMPELAGAAAATAPWAADEEVARLEGRRRAARLAGDFAASDRIRAVSCLPTQTTSTHIADASPAAMRLSPIGRGC